MKETYKNVMKITKIKKGFSKKGLPWELVELLDEGLEEIWNPKTREKETKKIKKCTLSVFLPETLRECFSEGDIVSVSGELYVQNVQDDSKTWSKKIDLKHPRIEALDGEDLSEEAPF